MRLLNGDAQRVVADFAGESIGSLEDAHLDMDVERASEAFLDDGTHALPRRLGDEHLALFCLDRDETFDLFVK
jgi:hypothetical protein